MIEFSVYQGLFFMMTTAVFQIRLRGIQSVTPQQQRQAQTGRVLQPGEIPDPEPVASKALMAQALIEFVDVQGNPVHPNLSAAQIALSPEHLEQLGSKILKTGTITITFD